MQTPQEYEYKSILLTLIDPPEDADRDSIDPSYIRELADSIKAQGLLQDPIVRPKGTRYEIVAGHRRYLAVSSLGWTHLTCKVKNATDEETSLARNIENILRFDLTPIEEAKSYRKLVDKHGLTIQQISERTGKTAVVIKKRLMLLTLHPDVVAAIHEKKIPVGVGEEINGIDDVNTLKYYLDLAIENGVTRDVIRMWVKEYKDNVRRSQNASVPFESLPAPMMERPTYLACDVCMGAVELNQLKLIRACPECLDNIDKAIKEASLAK